MVVNQPPDIVPLLSALVRANSVNPPGNEGVAASILADWLKERGVQAEIQHLSNTRANMFARVPGRIRGNPLVFCGHLDTVPPGSTGWTFDPFGAECAVGRMYGRGTSDMKGGLAAMAAALVLLQQQSMPLDFDVLFLATAGEEVDSIGARWFIERGVLNGAGSMIIGEPTGMEVAIAHKGALWLRVKVTGKTAHGSMPQLGSNAILNACRFLQSLTEHQFGVEAHPLLGLPTVSPNLISGGIGVNVIPDQCEVTCDIRTISSLTHTSVVEQIRHLLDQELSEDETRQSMIEVLLDRAPLNTDPSCPIVKVALAACTEVMGRPMLPRGMTYYTDASVIVPYSSIPTVVLGPGEAGQAHQANESIAIDQVQIAARIYERIALNYKSDAGAMPVNP